MPPHTNLPQPCPLPSPNPSKSFWHSEPSHKLLGHRSTPTLPEHADVVIVGSGITGTSVAWHLLEDGHGLGKATAPTTTTTTARTGSNSNSNTITTPLHILLLDAREACWGATGRNGGHCQPIAYTHAADPAIGRFEQANFAALKALVAALDLKCEFHEQGSVHALESPGTLAAAASALKELRERDAQLAEGVRLVTGRRELAELRVPGACGAVVLETAARLWPYKLVAGVLEELVGRYPALDEESHGDGDGDGQDGQDEQEKQPRAIFNLQTNTPVTSLAHAYDPSATTTTTETDLNTTDTPLWTLTTPRGPILTPTVILATNAYTSALLPSFADLITPVRGQMSALIPPPPPHSSLAGAARLRTSFVFAGHAQDDYLVQRSAARGETETLMFGGGRQCGPSVGVADDEVMDENVAAYLRQGLSRLLGPFEGPEGTDAVGVPKELQASHEWTGIMGYSRDERPWVGRVPGMGGVFLAAGYTGHGMPNAWLCGRAVAQMVQGDLGLEERGEEQEGVLPESYVLSAERMERARRLGAVDVTDEAHLAWAK